MLWHSLWSSHASTPQIVVALRLTVFKAQHTQYQYIAPPADEWEVARNRLTIKEVLGQGQYGKVCVRMCCGCC